MIISQDIKSGLVRVKRSGYYFSLISASGVVNVTLRLKGEDVLRTDFWVGMSINDPVEFDEILIQGDDAPVEFWASQISMSQSRATIKGATALRSTVFNLRGGKPYQIVGADVTRASVRIKSDQDILIGGAGLQSWPIAANVMEDIPAAGLIYGYKQPANINFDGSVITAETAGEWKSKNGNFWVSDDGNVRLQCSLTKTYRQDLTVSTDWFAVDDIDSVSSKTLTVGDDGAVYVLHYYGAGDYVRIRKTTDGGLTWSLIISEQNIGLQNTGASISPTSTHFTIRQGARLWFINIDGSAIVYNDIGATNTVYRVSRHNQNVIMQARINSITGMYQSSDGGLTFELLSDVPSSSFSTSVGGMVFLTDAKRIYESHSLYSGYKSVDDATASMHYKQNGMYEVASTIFWIEGKKLVYLSYLDDSPRVTEILSVASFADISGTGWVYPSAGGSLHCEQSSIVFGENGATVSYDIVGDIAPAKVQVMELLA